MNLLAFDTSTDTLFIAMQKNNAYWLRQSAGGAYSSAMLLPTIRDGLDALALTLTQLDAIVFGRGPGSFTGLRTACSVAQGLAFGSNRKVLPIDTLLAMAEQARVQYGLDEVMVVLDARMNEVYHAAYRWDSIQGQWQTTTTLGLCAPTAVIVPDGFPVVGNAHHVYADLAPQATHYPVLPTAEALLRLAPAFIASGALLDPRHATPYYLRDKVAQTTAERAALTQRIR